MEPVDGPDNAKPEGPGQVIDEVGELGVDVEPLLEAAVLGLVLGVLGLVVALVLGMREVREIRGLGEGLDIVVGAGALDNRHPRLLGEAVDDNSEVLAVLGGAPVVRVQPGPWLLRRLGWFQPLPSFLAPSLALA